MSYELVKELKDAGFHQRPYPVGYPKWDFEGTYSPTLSELIEVCMKFVTDHVPFTSSYDTRNTPPFSANIGHVEGSGKTPEEAVARLYIALNKK